MNRQEAAKILIHNDLYSMVAINEKLPRKYRGIFTLGFLLYFATIILNAVEWCKKAGIELNAVLDSTLLEKLRAKIKLYSSDNAIPLEEQKALMNDILAIEKQYWKDMNSKCLFRFLPLPDVGVYVFNGHNIGNTLEFAYEYSPFNPSKRPINIVMGERTEEKSLSFLYGYMIGQNTADLAMHFGLDLTQVRIQEKTSIKIGRFDFNLSKNKFFQSNENGLFAFNLVCRMNFLLELLIALCADHEMFVFRMIYITFYHLKFDLQELGLSFIHYDMPFRNKGFRNAMAHYSLFGKIEDNEIIPDVIGIGLFEKFFRKPFEVVNSAIIEEFKKTRDSLEEYVQVKGRVIYD